MREFIRLQLKLKWGYNRNNNKASAAMTGLAALFAVAVALGLVLALTYVLRTSLQTTGKELAQLYLTVIMAGLTVAATGMQMNRLYRPADLKISARFPLSPFKLFVGYLVLNYIDLCIYTAILTLPVMVVFGIAMDCFTGLYVLGMLLGTILMPLVPFALSVFAAIPLVYAAALLEKHGAVRLILFVAILAGCFVLYNRILTELAQFFIRRNWQQGTLEIWKGLLEGLDAYYNPAFYLGNVIFFDGWALGLGVLLGGSALLIAAGTALARVVCADIRKRALETGFGKNRRRSEMDGYGSGRAILRYGFKEILRTKTYAYFYLGVAISTPVMVFFCHRLVTLVGEAQVGAGINFGASMLVMSVFMAMISSFSGTVLSVEGKNFYITKLIPVPYRKQLLIKGSLAVGVSLAALAISVVVACSLEFLNAGEAAALVAAQILLAAGLVFNGINLNLANPSLKPKANGEAEEINIAYMLLIGLALSAVLGAIGIIFPRVFDGGKFWAYGYTIGAAALYALINFAVYWFTVDKKYGKIEG